MAGVPQLPVFRRQSGSAEIPQIEGYTISPVIAATSSCLLLSYVLLGLAPSAYVFATTTNLCYLAAGFFREAASVQDKHEATQLVGQMGGGSLILVLMGASSFAFHRESQIGAPAHTLDILFGWLLVTHVFYVSFSVALLAFAKFVLPDRLDKRGVSVVRQALAFSLLLMVTMLMTFYDTFYSHQQEFFFSLGPAAAVFGGITRFILVYEDRKLQWKAVGLALVEVVVALTATFAAIFSQGELLGRRLSRSTDPAGYDLFHGNWHFLLALVTSLLYSRAADAARIVKGTHVVCVCSLPLLDWAAEALVFVYSLLCIFLKETNVDTRSCTVVLGMVAAGFAVHGWATFFASLSGDVGGPLLTPRPLAPTPRGFELLRSRPGGRRTSSAPLSYQHA